MPASRRGGGPAETMPPRPSPPPHQASPPPPEPASADGLTAPVAQAQTLSRRVAELERAEQDRLSLLRQLVTAQEDERRRLAANLHDDTIQALAAALLHLDVLETRVDRAVRDLGDGGRDTWDAVRSSATRVRQNVEHGLQSARTFLFDLRPPVLDEAGLETALQRQLDRVAEQNDCAVELRWAVTDRLDPDRETILFRAVQEALANVVKHAHAAKVAIRAWRDGGMLVVEVADDGAGFDPVEAFAWATAAGHLGLRFMTERVEGAGGSLCIDAMPGQGTRVEFRLPAGGQGGDPVPLDGADQPGR